MTLGMRFYSNMTIPGVLETNLDKWPDHEAMVYRDTRINFTQLKELIDIAKW
jgi:hypothetical protein